MTYTVTIEVPLHNGKVHIVRQWGLSFTDALLVQRANEYKLGYCAHITRDE